MDPISPLNAANGGENVNVSDEARAMEFMTEGALQVGATIMSSIGAELMSSIREDPFSE